jgi:cell division transport system permease protein
MSARSTKPIPSFGLQGRGLVLAIVALMAALGVLAILAAGGLHQLAQRWQNALAGGLTVELPARASAAAREAETAKLLARLRETPGIAKAEPLSRSEIETLLAPWLGDRAALGALPLPVLVHVELAPGAAPATAELQAALQTVAADVRVDDHGRWRAQFAALARAVEWTAAAVLVTVGAAAAIAVAAAVRTRLLIHRDEVAVLHALGAADGFIARPIARDAWGLALRGGIAGLLLAAVIALGLLLAAGAPVVWRLDTLPVPIFALGMALAFPLAIAVLSVTTAWFSLSRTLRALEHERGF